MFVSPRSLPLAAVLAGTALPASADISPAEVWADWQRMLSTYGTTVDVGSEELSGDTLTVRDLGLSYSFPEDGGSFATTIPELVFEDRGDGTVEINISPEFDMDLTGTDTETGMPFAFTLVSRQPGLVTIASRDGDTTRYDYIGADISAEVDGIEVDGEEIDFNIEVTLTGTSGAYELTEGTPRQFSSRTAGDALIIAVDGTDPEDPASTFELDLTMNDIEGEGTGTVTALSGFADMSTMLSEGFDSEWELIHGEAEYTIRANSQSEVFNMTTTIGSGSFFGSISPDGLVYGVGNSDLNLSLSGSEIPFPQLTFSMAESEAEFAIPSVPSEEPSDFGLLLRLIDLEISEAVWNMFDPTGQLPRDPATLVLDIVGKGRWLVDIFDPDVADNLETDEAPGEIESLTIGSLALSAAGAELTGSGEFEFDNSGNGPFAPAPSPSGVANLELTGANALLDTLVNMGLMPQDQAMGARMMLGLFARPGDGPDTLVSTIEVGPDGSISANGQRIR